MYCGRCCSLCVVVWDAAVDVFSFVSVKYVGPKHNYGTIYTCNVVRSICLLTTCCYLLPILFINGMCSCVYVVSLILADIASCGAAKLDHVHMLQRRSTATSISSQLWSSMHLHNMYMYCSTMCWTPYQLEVPYATAQSVRNQRPQARCQSVTTGSSVNHCHNRALWIVAINIIIKCRPKLNRNYSILLVSVCDIRTCTYL